jgi:hypothetical protein
VYGDEYPITKEECVNHMTKRLTGALRKARQEHKLGGKGWGKLNDVTITKHGNYYRKAIKGHPNDREGMKTAIFAILYHSLSTDEVPRHGKCPPGNDSFCFYQRALSKNEVPGKHKDNLGSAILEKDSKHIIPIYQRLASNALLDRTLQGKTQNANENLHSVIWNLVPKTTFVSKGKVDIGIAKAVARHNLGIKSAIETEMTAFSGIAGTITTRISNKQERMAKKQTTRRSMAVEQQKRKKMRLVNLAVEARKREEEGDTYAAGVFDID